jgi:hypothetical protein
MHHKNFFVILLLGLFVTVLAGCGSPDSKYTKVEGTITYNGQPIEGATVTFAAADSTGESAAGITDADGKYTVTSSQALRGGAGVLPGEYVVLVSKRSAPPPDPNQAAFDRGDITYDELQKRKAMKGPYASGARPKDELPAKYAQQNQTDLKAAVAKGKTSVHNFELTD